MDLERQWEAGIVSLVALDERHVAVDVQADGNYNRSPNIGGGQTQRQFEGRSAISGLDRHERQEDDCVGDDCQQTQRQNERHCDWVETNHEVSQCFIRINALLLQTGVRGHLVVHISAFFTTKIATVSNTVTGSGFQIYSWLGWVPMYRLSCLALSFRKKKPTGLFTRFTNRWVNTYLALLLDYLLVMEFTECVDLQNSAPNTAALQHFQFQYLGFSHCFAEKNINSF